MYRVGQPVCLFMNGCALIASQSHSSGHASGREYNASYVPYWEHLLLFPIACFYTKQFATCTTSYLAIYSCQAVPEINEIFSFLPYIAFNYDREVASFFSVITEIAKRVAHAKPIKRRKAEYCYSSKLMLLLFLLLLLPV